MKRLTLRFSIAALAGGLTMWIVAGLWHNLVLPAVDTHAEAHHQGLGIMLLSYIILGVLMTYIYSLVNTFLSDNLCSQDTPIFTGKYQF